MTKIKIPKHAKLDTQQYIYYLIDAFHEVSDMNIPYSEEAVKTLRTIEQSIEKLETLAKY